MKNRIFILLVLFVLVLSACTPAASPTEAPGEEAVQEVEEAVDESQPSEYKIGVMWPMTGDLSAYGESYSKAVQMAADEINAAGGINGVPVTPVIEDDRCAGDGALSALTKLNSEGVPVVVGGLCSGAMLATCARFEEMEIVYMGMGGNEKIYSGDCGSYTFGYVVDNADVGPQMAKDVFNDLGIEEVAMLYSNNEYGRDLTAGFEEEYKALGGNILISISTAEDAKDFRTEITQLKDAAPEYTIFNMYPQAGIVYLKQAYELGFETQYLGETNWVEPSNLEPLGPAAEGMTAIHLGPVSSPEFLAFRDAYIEEFGNEPWIWAEYAYDMFILAAKAIEAGGYTGQGIRDALSEVSDGYIGASGDKTLQETKRICAPYFEWVKWTNGELVPLN